MSIVPHRLPSSTARAVGVATALLLGLLTVAVPTAHAGPTAAIPTGCGELDLADADAVAAAGRMADDVFVAKVVGVGGGFRPGSQGHKGETTGPGPGPDASPTDPGAPEKPTALRHHVVVTEPLVGDLAKGDPVRVQLIATAESERTQLRVDRTYVLFTKGEGPAVEADACEGWVLVGNLDQKTLDGLRAALAEPPATSEAEVELEANDEVDRDPPELGRILAPGGAVALIGVLGLVLISRIGRTRP